MILKLACCSYEVKFGAFPGKNQTSLLCSIFCYCNKCLWLSNLERTEVCLLMDLDPEKSKLRALAFARNLLGWMEALLPPHIMAEGMGIPGGGRSLPAEFFTSSKWSSSFLLIRGLPLMSSSPGGLNASAFAGWIPGRHSTQSSPQLALVLSFFFIHIEHGKNQ